MDYIRGFNRSQLVILDYESKVAQDSWARIVDLFVDILPLQNLGFKDVLHSEGRPPFHVSDLLKLYLYGYKSQIRSSRKLAHSYKVNLEVIWLLKGIEPSARTIAYFRKNNAIGFKNAFRYFVRVLKNQNLIDGEMVAIDSFKIRAQNSLKNNFNQKKIDRHKGYIDDKIDQYSQQFDSEDFLEENESVNKKEVLKGKIEYQEKKKKKYQDLEQKLESSGASQISTTDADARSVVLHRNIINVGYCIQAGCDSKHKLFINNDTGTVNDTHALSPMALDAKALLGLDKLKVITDKGYTTGQQIDICTKNNITTFSSPKAHSSQHNGLYDMQIFKYDRTEDNYTCPAGEILATNGTIYSKGKHKIKHYKNRRACKTCALVIHCTKNKNGRYTERSIYQESLEGNAKRVENNPHYYSQRQQITEHQFGTLKRQWGFTYTLMKGKENVLSEVNLIMICYNLKRLMSIFTPKGLKQFLRELWFYFLGDIALILSPNKLLKNRMI